MGSMTTERQRLRAACDLHGVAHRERPGVFMIDLAGIDAVLGELEGDYKVLGFDTFTLDGDWVSPRLDYMTDFGEGLGVADALAVITHWPRDAGLWVEAVIAPEDAS